MNEEILKIFMIIMLHSAVFIGLTIRLEDSLTVMATGICTKIFLIMQSHILQRDLMQTRYLYLLEDYTSQ